MQKIFHTQYWDSSIYLKIIHTPNVLRPVIFLEIQLFGIFDEFLYEGMGILNWDFRSFLHVVSWYIFVVRTFFSVIQYVNILRTLWAVFQFVLLYLW